jgi:hypothetical protein
MAASRIQEMRAGLIYLLAAIVAAGLGFIGAIVSNPGSGVVLHEVAASILLVLLGVALAISYRLRTIDRRPMYRIGIALGALVVAAGIGASLAAKAAEGGLAGLPLIPLGAMLASVGDGIRVTLNLPKTGRPGGPEFGLPERRSEGPPPSR